MDNEEEILKECYCCGSEHDVSDMHQIDGEYYCDDCISYCEMCDRVCLSLTHVSSSHHNGILLCDECIDNHTFTCDHCGDITLDSEMIGDGNISLCQYCYENSYGTCYSCDCIFHNDELYYSDNTGEVYCEACYHEEEDNEDSCNLHSYGFKPSAIFHHASHESNLYKGYGLEIETDKKSGNRRDYIDDLYFISDNESIFYLKEDGSLSSNGVEIVTHVGTYQYWMNSNIFDQIRKIALLHHYRSHDIESCGLHIHASKELFGDTDQEIELSITKTIILLDRFWDKIIKISRRSEESINNWASKYDLDKPSFNEVYGKANHYRVMCLTHNTVELRMFKGTLKVSSIKSAIEFYDRLIMFSRVMSLETVLKCSFNQLREYLEKDTIYLSEYLNERIGDYDKPSMSLCFDHMLDMEDISYEHEIIIEKCNSDFIED